MRPQVLHQLEFVAHLALLGAISINYALGFHGTGGDVTSSKRKRSSPLNIILSRVLFAQINEYTGKIFTCEDVSASATCVRTGEIVLRSLGFASQTVEVSKNLKLVSTLH